MISFSQRRTRPGSGQSGQTMVEYILLTAVIVLGIILFFALLRDAEFIWKRLSEPVIGYIKYNYKYGDPNALGWDEGGGPRKHIQIAQPNAGQTFRIFLPEN